MLAAVAALAARSVRWGTGAADFAGSGAPASPWLVGLLRELAAERPSARIDTELVRARGLSVTPRLDDAGVRSIQPI